MAPTNPRLLTTAEKCLAIKVITEAHPDVPFNTAVMIVDYVCDLHANPLDLDPQLAATLGHDIAVAR